MIGTRDVFSDPRGSVVKIFNTAQHPNWVMPWQAGVVESSTGSGAVIELPGRAGSNGILTAAHVVANARFLQLQRSSDRFSSERSQARVAAICHEIDLALLVPEGESWAEMKPLAVASADRLPQIFDRVRVCGYPLGGNACSVTEGVVSRIEVQEYSHSLRPALALTVDAAINSGNSGGPLLDARTGEIVGVAFQKLVAQGVELQGHAVPAPLICQFLRQVAAAASLTLGVAAPLQVRMPCLGCDFQTLEPLALRRSLGLKDSQAGILVLSGPPGNCVPPGPQGQQQQQQQQHQQPQPQLQQQQRQQQQQQELQLRELQELRSGDVLLTFDGLSLDSSGFCKVLGQRLHFAAARDLRGVGEVVQLTVWRGSQEVALNVRLRPEQNLVPRPQFDCCPPFFVCGGLVFQPLSFEYLQAWEFGSEPTHLRDLFRRGRLQPDRTEAVVLTQILGDDINQGYGSGFVGAPVVVSVNGQQVVNLAHLVRLVRTLRAQAQSTDDQADAAAGTGRAGVGFLQFDTEGSFGPIRLVLPLAALDEADSRVALIYGVPECSAHFAESPENYLLAGNAQLERSNSACSASKATQTSATPAGHALAKNPRSSRL